DSCAGDLTGPFGGFLFAADTGTEMIVSGFMTTGDAGDYSEIQLMGILTGSVITGTYDTANPIGTLSLSR
ncbi:MAG: hypothetical protein ACYSU0_16085, partial [Planctomycetota bacterium]